jgi:hypothetical protein
MSSTRSNRRLALASMLIGASLATLSGSAAASGDEPPGAVVETTGDPATAITLPPAPPVDARAQTVTDIGVGIAAGSSTLAFAVRLVSSVGIDDVTADGGYATTSTFDQVLLTSGADRIDPAAFDVLTGMTFRQVFARNGRLTAVEPVGPEVPTNEQMLAFASITGNLKGSQTIYPDEAVGVGARWTVEQAVSGDSFPVTADYHYELTAIADGRYTASVSYTAAFDTVVDGVATTGTVSGLGSINGAVDDPLDVSYRLGQTTDGIAGANAIHVEVTVAVMSTRG